MKITKSELRKIINEELEVVLTNEEAGDLFGEEVRQQLESHDDGEGSMAVKQLNNIGMMSGDVLDLVDDSDNLDEWVEAKITKAHDYLNSVFNHLRGESVHHVSLAERKFKSGQKVTHEEYGVGIVTHPGTKDTDVAVQFKNDTGRGRNITVSRWSLK